MGAGFGIALKTSSPYCNRCFSPTQRQRKNAPWQSIWKRMIARHAGQRGVCSRSQKSWLPVSFNRLPADFARWPLGFGGWPRRFVEWPRRFVGWPSGFGGAMSRPVGKGGSAGSSRLGTSNNRCRRSTEGMRGQSAGRLGRILAMGHLLWAHTLRFCVDTLELCRGPCSQCAQVHFPSGCPAFAAAEKLTHACHVPAGGANPAVPLGWEPVAIEAGCWGW